MRCACASWPRVAPSARSRPASRVRSACDPISAAYSTSTPEASVNMNRNSTATTTWSSTSCTWRMMPLTSMTVRFGHARVSVLARPMPRAARWNAVMYVVGASFIAAGLMMTKKFARIDPHSSLRRLVIFASTIWPPMSKRIVSPSFKRSVFARPCSTEASATPGASRYQRPATTSFVAGRSAVEDRLNSRSARPFARSSV